MTTKQYNQFKTMIILSAFGFAFGSAGQTVIAGLLLILAGAFLIILIGQTAAECCRESGGV